MSASGHEDFDTAWLAYRYVSGELDGAELTRFEERLSIDQSARETVAEVVDLCAAIGALPRSTFSPAASSLRIWPAVRWMAVGAAACLAIVFAVQSAMRGPGLQHTAQSNDTDPAGDRRLALTWTQQSSAHESPLPDAEGPGVTDDAGSNEAETGDSEASEAENSEAENSEPEINETHNADGLEPPDWVTAAIDESAKPASPASTKPASIEIEETP
jgi:hypothetical protein